MRASFFSYPITHNSDDNEDDYLSSLCHLSGCDHLCSFHIVFLFQTEQGKDSQLAAVEEHDHATG